tara:strand:- start:850 stop:1932 length:1083 start_codon:yes stop_codon:yes gene_type:complete
MARNAKGLSTRAVALQLKPASSVSHASIANYEKGITSPPIDIVSALATLYDRPINWLLGDGPVLSGIRYRNLKSKVGVGDRHRFEGESQRWLDAYLSIERHLGEELDAELDFVTDENESPADSAARLRKELGLSDSDPLKSVVELLEKTGTRVIGVDTDLAIDGLAACLGEDHVVVLNGTVSNDRARMNAAHELGHIVNGDCGDGEESKEEERGAFEFASHLLLTPPMLQEAFKRKSMVRLVEFKELFGISLAAMVFRAEDDGLISHEMARKLWIEFSKRGWRKREPGSVRADRPTRFESLLDCSIVEKDYTIESLAEITGVREDELKRRLVRATGFLDDADDEEMEENSAALHRLRLVR